MLSNVPNPYTVVEANKWIKKTQNAKDDLHFCIYRHKFLGVVSVRIDENGNAVKQGESIEIGGNDRYIALCRKHFMENIGWSG